jgi:hypothetical protein
MKKWFTLCALMFCVGVANAQHAEYPDVPFSDSAYADITILTPQSGIIDCCYGPCPEGPRLMTRYEFAVAVARLSRQMGNNKVVPARLFLTPQQASALKRLYQEFKPEVISLGVPTFTIEECRALNIEKNPPQWETQFFLCPIVVAPPFPDVPKNHWAFSAVEKLRQDGVLLGYPNGAAVEAGN